ncbi:MAG: serine/threonine protein kinase, partial [Planctomycetales bacterium]|nr:serine/threonine protein kinase [Planctomycetales bacterium]
MSHLRTDPAERVGPYEVLERLGGGGPDRVYRARDSRPGREGDEVAVKVLVLGEDAAPEELRRFFREVALARDLDHPGVLPVLEWGEEGGRAWFARRHVPGRTLESLLRENVLPCGRALAIARDLADALGAAHAKGILHRDVSPETIWVDLEGKPYLCDFGLAKSVTTGSKYTRTGVALGSPRTMSPEQARGEIHGLTPATDVWGLGCVLYEMLAGRPPFDADS